MTACADQILRGIHRTARRNSLTVEIVRLPRVVSERLGESPFRWRMSVCRPDGLPVVSIAFERSGELPEIIGQIWSTFGEWGLT